MSNTAITLCVLIFSRVDAKHFLVETEDDNSEAEGLGDLPGMPKDLGDLPGMPEDLGDLPEVNGESK